MVYRMAAIDVHKKMLAVVVADVAGGGEYHFERRQFGATPDQLHRLAQWLIAQEVEEVVLESTAPYWRPVWGARERYWQPVRRKREGAGPMAGRLPRCPAKSNRGRRGRKNDFADRERLLKRLVAQELGLSFVPDPEQRLWRTLTRRKSQLIQDQVRFRNQWESLLEQGQLKRSSFVSDLLGVSARRMWQALAEGETDPAALAALADCRLRATPEELCDARGAARELPAVYRRLLGMALEELEFMERQIQQLEPETAVLLQEHQEAVQRLAEVPGFGVDSAIQMMAEVGPRATNFPSAKDLSSWIGVCPGENKTAGESQSTRSPKGNRPMRRILNQAAPAAGKMRGSIWAATFRRLLTRMPYKEAIWAIAHRLARLLWLILHQGVRYEERGPAVSAKSQRRRTARMIKELQKLGYRVEAGPLAVGALA